MLDDELYTEEEQIFNSEIMRYMGLAYNEVTGRDPKKFDGYERMPMLHSDGEKHSLHIRNDGKESKVSLSFNKALGSMKLEHGPSAVQRISADDLVNNLDSVKKKISDAIRFEARMAGVALPSLDE